MNFSVGACVTCQSGVVMTSVHCGHDLAIYQVDTWDSLVFITASGHWKLLLSLIINSCYQLRYNSPTKRMACFSRGLR